MKEASFWRRVLANIAALFSGTAVARAFSAWATVLIARQVRPAANGQYNSTMALVEVTSVFFALGLDGWLLYHGGREEAELSDWLSAGFSLKFALGIVWMVVLWAVGSLLDPSAFPWCLVFLGSLICWSDALSKLIWNALKVRLRSDLTLALTASARGLFLGITYLLAARQVNRVTAYAGGRLVAAALAAGVSVYLGVRMLGLRLRFRAVRSTLLGALPFAVSYALSMVYGRADQAIVSARLGSAAAGIYGPAVTLMGGLFLIPIAVYGVTLPVLSKAFAEDGAWARRIALGLIMGMAVLGSLLGVGLAVLSGPIVGLLFGQAYTPSADVLYVLSGVVLLRCPNVALAGALVSVGWQMPRIGVQAVSALLNVALNLVLARHLGVMGVAAIYVLSEAALFAGYLGMLVLWMWKKRSGSR